MIRALAVLRPEPGNAATAARAGALGFATIRLPLFAVQAVAWQAPDPADHDALILTSANTLRHAGPALAGLRGLPVFAVGERTAAAARDAGLSVVATGHSDAADLLATARARGIANALYLGGRDRKVAPGDVLRTAITVYASDPLAVPDAQATLAGTVALLHSARAARRLGELIADRRRLRIAALSPDILAAAGPGWDRVAAAATPTDAALLECAATLAIKLPAQFPVTLPD